MKKWLSNSWVLAILFISALWGYERLVLPFHPNDFVETFPPLLNLVIQAVAIAILIPILRGSFVSRPWVRVLSWIIFCMGILSEYGYCDAMGRFSITEDYFILDIIQHIMT